ncbi:TetR/AcrR family transcriptional regulator [Streptomyces sp. HNM0574]|uniref:TetR/AcrR family transcriptional regulator n=1 Tax=Streptomyces sp. HNM0574 TaxID=2714954 RepID=UPI00146F723A|nr:TetR/AcrR family transcriptional regulator [Streptomyces sp. HNM0574]NLU68845.1 TetR/AcrR family transcriptional regulator [Streptomyces sp. HNM0574]
MSGGTVSGETVRGAAKGGRAAATRESILAAAERLFAEHGVAAVSNRQISEAAGQGNNTAVGYHFGSKDDLVRAVVRKHNGQIERLREEMVERAEGSAELRDWVACTVLPTARHLSGLGTPTWFGRFYAQISTDPAYRDAMAEESLGSPALVRAVDGLNRCLPDLPLEVRVERGDMARQVMVHMLAERERALAVNAATPRTSWQQAATGIVDALTGLWLAPVTHPKENQR